MVKSMLSNSDLERLLVSMRASGVTTLEVKHSEKRLRLVLPASRSPLMPAVKPALHVTPLSDREQHSVNSPFIGTFLQRGIDDGLTVLKAGMRITAGEVLGYVCKGPVRVIIEAPVNGVLDNDGPVDGAVLGLGDVVFTLEETR